MLLTLLLVLIYISFISLGLPDSILGTAWPAAYKDLGVPISWAGIISATISGGTIISSWFSNRIISRLGTGVTTVVSVAMTAVALLGVSLSGSFWFLLLFAIPLGLGAGSVDAALNNFVALHYQAKHMNWLHCFWGIGASAGPVIMSISLTSSNWQTGYAAIGWLQVALVIILLLSLPLWKRFSSGAQSEGSRAQVLSTRELLRIPGAKPILVAFFCYCAVEATAGLWGSSFLVLTKGISPQIAARWISLYYFGITFGRFLSGLLTLKIANRDLIRLGQGMSVLGILLLLLPAWDFVFSAGFFVIGLGCAPIFPALLHDTPENFGAELSQAIMGMQMACAYVGTTTMPPLFGFLAQRVSMILLPFYLLVIALLMVAMVELLNRLKAQGLTLGTRVQR
ncbi:MAG: MFS transporter [Firmicutes bacterium]|nr:MFS transporter [Bacillota bacterium]